MNKTIPPPRNRSNDTYSPNREETLGKMLKKRNSLLIKLFRDTGYDVKLIGDAEKPKIIIDDKIQLSAYAHNFELRFMDQISSGECIYKVKINHSNHIPKNFFEVYLKEVEHLPASFKKKRKRTIKTKIEKIERRRNGKVQ